MEWDWHEDLSPALRKHATVWWTLPWSGTKTVSEFLQSLGLERAWSDPCLWMWRPQGVLRGLISGHVDDFLFGGSEDDPEWQGI